MIPVPGEFTKEYLRINAGVIYIGDNTKARRELGFNPRPLAEGMTETLKSDMTLLSLRQIPEA